MAAVEKLTYRQFKRLINGISASQEKQQELLEYLQGGYISEFEKHFARLRVEAEFEQKKRAVEEFYKDAEREND